MDNWIKKEQIIPELYPNPEDNDTIISDVFGIKLRNGKTTYGFLIGETPDDMIWWDSYFDDIIDESEITHLEILNQDGI